MRLLNHTPQVTTRPLTTKEPDRMATAASRPP